MGKPFARANALVAAMAMALLGGIAATNFSVIEKARREASGYESRGKGGKRAHRPTGIAGVRRAACKARNVKANRRAHR